MLEHFTGHRVCSVVAEDVIVAQVAPVTIRRSKALLWVSPEITSGLFIAPKQIFGSNRS